MHSIRLSVTVSWLKNVIDTWPGPDHSTSLPVLGDSPVVRGPRNTVLVVQTAPSICRAWASEVLPLAPSEDNGNSRIGLHVPAMSCMCW